mmetsp:Transcript_22710/g.38069  ORF Transcript_22710/g.38069 Transcript_22710/m.38069 type:complete len:839 (+) Transcript_22710:109-2625(+)
MAEKASTADEHYAEIDPTLIDELRRCEDVTLVLKCCFTKVLKPGVKVYLSGSGECLGAWNPKAAICFGDGEVFEFKVPASQIPLNFKFVVMEENRVIWQRGPNIDIKGPDQTFSVTVALYGGDDWRTYSWALVSNAAVNVDVQSKRSVPYQLARLLTKSREECKGLQSHVESLSEQLESLTKEEEKKEEEEEDDSVLDETAKLRAQNLNLIGRLEELTKELESREKEMREKIREQDEIKKERDELRRDVNRSLDTTRGPGLQSQLDYEKRKTEKLQEDLAKLKKISSQSQADYEALKVKMVALETELSAVKNEEEEKVKCAENRLREEYQAELESQLELCEKEFKGQLAKSQSESEELRVCLRKEAEKHLAKLKSDRDAFSHHIDQLKEMNDRSEARLAEAVSERDALKDRTVELEVMSQQTEALLAESLSEREALKDRTRRLEVMSQQIEGQLVEAVRERDESLSERDALSQLLQQLKETSQQIGAQLAKSLRERDDSLRAGDVLKERMQELEVMSQQTEAKLAESLMEREALRQQTQDLEMISQQIELQLAASLREHEDSLKELGNALRERDALSHQIQQLEEHLAVSLREKDEIVTEHDEALRESEALSQQVEQLKAQLAKSLSEQEALKRRQEEFADDTDAGLSDLGVRYKALFEELETERAKEELRLKEDLNRLKSDHDQLRVQLAESLSECKALKDLQADAAVSAVDSDKSSQITAEVAALETEREQLKSENDQLKDDLRKERNVQQTKLNSFKSYLQSFEGQVTSLRECLEKETLRLDEGRVINVCRSPKALRHPSRIVCRNRAGTTAQQKKQSINRLKSFGIFFLSYFYT